VLVLLALFRVALGFVSVPLQYVQIGEVASTIIFVAAPVFALYFAAKYEWTTQRALVFLVTGLVIHFGIGTLLGHVILHDRGFAAAVCTALATHVGLVMWCVGLGALLATFLKDKNLLIPVSIFLAAFDIFLVLTPSGVTKQIVTGMPQVLQTIGYSVPRVTTTATAPTGAPVHVFAYIGPADFLFMGMFFVALFRFGLRARLTLLWLIPTVLVYLILIGWFPAIPLLVPIGLTVLLVNLPEFHLNKEEKLSTLFVVVLAAVIILGGNLLRVRRAGPSQPEPGASAPAPRGSP